MHTISKTDFVRFLECPRYAWLCKNRKDLCKEKEKRTLKVGKDVEERAHALFETGETVPWPQPYQLAPEVAAAATKDFMADPAIQVIYQATVHTDQYLCRADIMVRDADGKGWHLYEVKATNSVKPKHLADICFQAIVFEQSFQQTGVQIYSYNLVHLNKNYRYNEKDGLDLKQFFMIEDVTEKVRAKKQEYADQMPEAHRVLTGADEPHPLVLRKRFDFELPPLLEKYYRDGIPEYSIYDIAWISKKELLKLSGDGIKLIKDIPDDFFKASNKKLQVQITKSGAPFIDAEGVREVLATYEYPLYFLDYETVNPAVPIFDGMWPYRQVTFQYSLHVQRVAGAALEHFEFLHTEKDNPEPHLLKRLRAEIDDGQGNVGNGTIFVWNQTFEKGRNKDMAATYPEHNDFLLAVNARVRDLMEIFDKDLYADYRFKGGTSIKKVLPILVPGESYETLGIQHGDQAMEAWYMLQEGVLDPADRAKLIQDMLTYCGQDTMAMVKILEFLRGI